MDDEQRARLRSNPLYRIVRWAVPWIALGAVLYVLSGVAADFRANKSVNASTETSVTAETTGTPVTGMTGTALVDAVHMRDLPAVSGAILADLKKGDPFDVLEMREGWLRVKDAKGHVGWITSDANFVKTVQK